MKGNKLCLCFLLAAGVGLGAHAQNKIAAPMKDVNQVVDNTLDSLNVVRSARPVSGSSRKGDNPVLFLVGNSTMRTGTLGNGNNGQWGWGYFEHEYFDENKITVENHALGGTSSRTFYNRLWPDVLKGVRKGDWVIIELGHNDNGPYDSGRARASIPGIGKDSLNVTIKETGAKETVYTYGEYMRRFIHDVKKKGAHPILMSLTPRNAWEDADSTIITRVNQTFGLWAKQVAKKARVPFIDLNDISARKFEKFGKEKVKYMFYLDRIHTSAFGARVNAESAAEGIRNYKGLELARYLKPVEKDTVTGATRKKGNPVLFTVGDSTVKNADKEEDGMWGWGSQAYTIFNPKKITCVNAAKAGRSSRSYLNEGRWEKVYNSLQPGDYVLIEFGHNDICSLTDKKMRGSIPCAKDTCHVYQMEESKQYEVVYSFGWYLKKFIQDVREKGATPILVSLTPRNEWAHGKMERRNNSYGKWYREVVAETGVAFLDLHNIAADSYDKIGKEKVKAYYKKDHTHTSLKGARHNARCVAKGLKKMKSPLAKYLK